MAVFSTEAQVMRQVAGDVDRTSEETRGDLNRLRAIAESTAGSWAGAAQVSFIKLMERYDRASIDLQDALQSIANNIRANARNFESTDTDNVQAFDNVGAGLNLS